MTTRLACAFTIFLLLGTTETILAAATASIETPGINEPIRPGYETYTLFLICNPQWLDQGKNAELIQLYREFTNFGRAIGHENAAVWFLTIDNHLYQEMQVAKNMDIERSVRFCKSWKLKPSEGPHIVVTSTFPDEAHLTAGLPAHNAVYKLGNMAPEQISALLTKLTDELVYYGSHGVDSRESDTGGSAAARDPTFWVRLLDATQQTLNSFGCAWTFKVSAGPVVADLKPCKRS